MVWEVRKGACMVRSLVTSDARDKFSIVRFFAKIRNQQNLHKENVHFKKCGYLHSKSKSPTKKKKKEKENQKKKAYKNWTIFFE